MTKNIEQRGGVLGVEMRMDAGTKTLVGYASVFNQDATIGNYFVERVAPGAFDGTLGGDIRALVDHDTGRVIGRTKSGTLRLSVDSHGLKIEIDVPDTADGRDLWTLVERGDISGMSIGFQVTKDMWDETGDIPVRTVMAINLIEVSAVAFPAFDGTEIGVRSLESAREELESARAAELAKKDNAQAAKRRIAERTAKQEQSIRGIRQDAS